MRQKLLETPNLTLQSAIDICKSFEQTKNHLMDMNRATVPIVVDAVNPCGSTSNNSSKNMKAKFQNDEEKIFSCTRCGQMHKLRSCPAYNKTCSNCKKLNHFASICKMGKKSYVKSVNLENENVNVEPTINMDTLFINSVDDLYNKNDWFEMGILPHQVKVNFKLDTGAQCNVLSVRTANLAKLEIRQSKVTKLISFTNNELRVLGETEAFVKFRNVYKKLVFIIVDACVQPILGRASCVQLGFIVRRTDCIKTIIEKNDNIFQGLGCLKNFEYDIDLVDDPKLKICMARKIPYPIRDQVKKEIDSMIELGIVKKVTEPTPAVSPLVVIQQKDKLRLCLDPSSLNRNIKRRHHPLGTMEEIATNLKGSKWFTLLDCRKGFWQIKVTPRTSKYLTFATPWGRFSFLRVPFGLASAPELFQQIMSSLLAGIKGVEVSMDDILLHAPTHAQLTTLTESVIEILRNAGLKLNPEKCYFFQNELKFLGHIISEQGLKPDPEKVDAIKRLLPPSNAVELQRVLGMATYLAKFIPGFSELTEPLRELLKKENAFIWDIAHQIAFDKLKNKLIEAPTLRFYNRNEPVLLSVDASQHSLGAVLLQNQQPVAYASRTLSAAERNYSQIEKEAAALNFGCKKFHNYIWGHHNIIIETDHKPLESIMKKPLNQAPPRLQRLLLEICPYNAVIKYKKGSELHIADTLSRNCKPKEDDECYNTEKITICQLGATSVFSADKLEQLKALVNSEAEMITLKNQIWNGWPQKLADVPPILKKYWTFKDELAYHDGVLVKSDRIIIPPSMREEVLMKLHLGHPGIQRSLRLARDSVFWPEMNSQIQNYIKDCAICQENHKDNPNEPIIIKEIPERPWEIVASDIFHFKNKNYVLICDSYSGFFDFWELRNITSTAIIKALKYWFSLHGIPDLLYTDEGTQYTSQEFRSFAKEWGFLVKTSSPHFHRSNGLVERYVQEAKSFLKKCLKDKKDVQLCLLHLRNIPRVNLPSPAQSLMGRRTKTLLPLHSDLLLPELFKGVTEKLSEVRNNQKKYADRLKKYGKEYSEGEEVYLRLDHRNWAPATVVKKTDHPRSYIVRNEEGKEYRRNRWFLRRRRNTSSSKREDVT